MARARQVVVLVAVAAALALAGPRADARPPTTLHLTATVTKDTASGPGSDKIVLALRQGKRTVGSANFPGCAGAGTDVNCGGTVTIQGLGTKLQTLVVWTCGATPPCRPGQGDLATKGGAVKGSITLKVQPSDLTKGKKFPVVVKET